MLQGKNAANEATDECVKPLMPGCRVAQSASEQLQLCELSRLTFGFTTREFSMVGGYMENPAKLQNCVKIGGWALARVWAFARDNTVLVKVYTQ